MRVPLHHNVRVIGQPNGALRGHLAPAVIEQGFLPFFIDGTARLAQLIGHPHRLDRILRFEFPTQILALNELA